jgi:hypothetical protein
MSLYSDLTGKTVKYVTLSQGDSDKFSYNNNSDNPLLKQVVDGRETGVTYPVVLEEGTPDQMTVTWSSGVEATLKFGASYDPGEWGIFSVSAE